MEELISAAIETNIEVNSFDKIKKLGSDSNSYSPATIFTTNLKPVNNLEDSSDEEAPVQISKKRIQRFSDSDSETDTKSVSADFNNDKSEKLASKMDSEDEDCYVKSKTMLTDVGSSSDANTKLSSKTDSEHELVNPKSTFKKSRIQLNSDNSDSDEKEYFKSFKNEEQQMRMKNKRSKLKDKFKSLLSSREKHVAPDTVGKKSSDESQDSDQPDHEISTVNTIKQKIKKSMTMIPSICDPDTSDEENISHHKEVSKYKQKKERRRTKPTSPKPLRISAKQAMENMQKIKSESNRRLREKEVSLPYHRPKALSLKDIMNRRRPAVTSDGKALPIKMNEEQLKQYVLMLEQRQKEMMELCKSESEEEDIENKTTVEIPPSDTNKLAEVDIKNNDEKTETINDNEIDSQGNPISFTKDMTTEFVDNNITGVKTHDVEKASANTENCVLEIVEQEKEIVDVNVEDSGHDSIDTDMKLLYNDSIEESSENIEISVENPSLESDANHVKNSTENIEGKEIENKEQNEVEFAESMSRNISEQSKVCTEPESHIISLHNDSEKTENNTEQIDTGLEPTQVVDSSNPLDVKLPNMEISDVINEDFMSDDEFNIDDIDQIIENAEIIKENGNTTMPSKEVTLNMKPKLTGTPGMVIDLDGDPVTKRLSGVELLKERFTYFAKLKTPEELERAREKNIKPGAQHLKLKQDLEDQIAEQRSLEWAKRLEDVKQHQKEVDAIRGDTSDVEDDIEKMEAKLEEKEATSDSDEELVEDDIEIKDKPRKHNPMLDEEAEESECDDVEDNAEAIEQNQDEIEVNNDQDDVNDEGSEDYSEQETSESEEEEETTKSKKGRILKAFEDSDDENSCKDNDNIIVEAVPNYNNVENTIAHNDEKVLETRENCEKNNIDLLASQANSQDDEIQLAQRHKSASDDLFSSQEIASTSIRNCKDKNNSNEVELGTQTFSILDSEPPNPEFKTPDEMDLFCGVEPYHDPKLAALASGLSQNVLSSQITETQLSPSQPIGEDILALCTGQFYNNQFVSQTDDKSGDIISQRSLPEYNFGDEIKESSVNNNLHEVNDCLNTEETTKHLESLDNNIKTNENSKSAENNEATENRKNDGNLLKCILDELNDPEFDVPKPNKFFTGATLENNQNLENTQTRKKFIIDSDDETDKTEQPIKKKLKKKKLEKRALHISDDEEEEDQDEDQDEDEQYGSDVEEDNERVVDYDSEENEIEVKHHNPKKKRKATDYFEQEAELTSEDEWVGSGDEDEAGLDRMEREEGDDDVFHQGQLRKELGQIHMRDVLDQDKREVRLLQELLFEDGDLGDGHRQRKFRWRNADGDEETGTKVDEFGDTQEDEFESEEQWRKQRHEREVFLRQMQTEDEDLNVSVNRTTIIKANLSSKTMSSLLIEANQSQSETDSPAPAPEKKTAKDIPSPKKSFAILQQNYHGSLLTRGRGALARLAALATPLAADDDAPKIGSLAPSSKRNFVFAALTPDDKKPKVTIKRKADTNLGTPKLVKKMKTEEKQKSSKSSLLDHLKVL